MLGIIRGWAVHPHRSRELLAELAEATRIRDHRGDVRTVELLFHGGTDTPGNKGRDGKLSLEIDRQLALEIVEGLFGAEARAFCGGAS